MKKMALLKWSFLLFAALLLACCGEEMDAIADVDEKIGEQSRDNRYAAEREEEAYERSQCSEGYYYSSCCSKYNLRCAEDCAYSSYPHYTEQECCSYYGIKCYSSSSSSYYGYSSSSSSYQSESEKCRLGTSAYSDSYCCSTYGYQCKSYLESSKSMKFCLTYFETENNWDGLGVGDPEISFTIYAITSAGQSTTIYTGKLLDKDNTKFWSGNSCTTKTIPALTQTIKVCPTVIDEDVSSDGDDNYSSRMCYSVSSIGYLKDYDEQEQSDYRNSDCTVKWEWYLY